MKAIAKVRFIHGAISAKKGEEIKVSETVVKELAAAGLVSFVDEKNADEKQPAATKAARKTAAKTAGA